MRRWISNFAQGRAETKHSEAIVSLMICKHRRWASCCFIASIAPRSAEPSAGLHLVSLNHIRHWRNDSLYVHADDMESFCQEYGRIFDSGVFGNLKTGTIDLFGLNYYSPALIESVIEKLGRERPRDYKELMAWLVKSRAHNGIYILGI